MSDFIELTELYLSKEGYTQQRTRVFNKALITDIQEDKAHDQSFIIYEGKEVTVRETLAQINSKSAE
jgi:hypothetical protein